MIRELDNGSIVVGTDFKTIKALNVSISYADKTKVETTITVGDIVLLTYIVSGRVQRVCGDVKDIRTDHYDARLIMDFSKAHDAHVAVIHINDIKDISNITAPKLDKHYDAEGNLIVDPPVEEMPPIEDNKDQQQKLSQIFSGADSADDFEETDESEDQPDNNNQTDNSDTNNSESQI